MSATSRNSPRKNRVRGYQREADLKSVLGRLMTPRKTQASALGGTVGVGDQAYRDRFAETTLPTEHVYLSGPHCFARIKSGHNIVTWPVDDRITFRQAICSGQERLIPSGACARPDFARCPRVGLLLPFPGCRKRLRNHPWQRDQLLLSGSTAVLQLDEAR
jgi:hypothetical protein